jgi:electron transport complex protein RnfB
MARAELPPVAFVDEPNCVGCARCLDACPTDAIVGALNLMHTVIAADCTGCERCIPVCPTDCIEMQPRGAETATRTALAARWRRRIRARRARLAHAVKVQAEARRLAATSPDPVAAALARACPSRP